MERCRCSPRTARCTPAILLFLVTATAVAADPSTVANDIAAPAFSPARLRADVGFLADDLLEGRGIGTPGHEIAARYVATQFEAAGLKPGGSNGSWYQEVTFQRTARGEDPGWVEVIGSGGTRRFTHAENVLVGLNAREPQLDVTAPLVFVGFGLEDQRLGLDDYRGLDVEGRIVVALRGFPKGFPSEEGAHLTQQKFRIAQSHGAIGFLSVPTLLSEQTFPWARELEYANDPEFTWVGTDGKAFNEAPGIRVYALVRGPAAEAVFEGSRRKLADVLREADKDGAKPRGFALKTQVRVKGTSTWTRLTSPNVVAILPGNDPALAGEYVMVSSHLDHLGIKEVPDVQAADVHNDNIYNGAVDNAVGVAALLEVARAAATTQDKPRRSLLFLVPTGEEAGLLGSDYYARHPTVALAQVVGNVNLDTPLVLYPFTDVIAFGADHSTIGQAVTKAVALMNIKSSPDPMPEQAAFIRSDHYPFVRQGVPAVFLIPGMANGGDKAWPDYLEKSYHTPHDDSSQPLDWQAAARFAEVCFRMTHELATSDTPPLWYAGDYFGDTFAPNAARAPRAEQERVTAGRTHAPDIK